MVTTRVTTMGRVAPALSELVVPEDRPEFFVALDLEKNEESDPEGRTIVSDIIMDWVERRGSGKLGCTVTRGRYDHRSRVLRSILSHTPPGLLSHFSKLVEDGARRRAHCRTQEEEEIQEGKR